ncbi:hypothetical protein [Pseudomonas sp. NPDC089734]|uniref:hypothetical protein n=1 Tax=Pseudomonas sp. NPDC089734 TaxID=3364469 RepID=UPI003825CE9C
MTTPEQTPASENVADPVPETGKKAVIAPFSFPFKPSEFTQTAKGQPWYQKSNSSAHHKTPGAAPPGTRRSMGKR